MEKVKEVEENDEGKVVSINILKRWRKRRWWWYIAYLEQDNEGEKKAKEEEEKEVEEKALISLFMVYRW